MSFQVGQRVVLIRNFLFFQVGAQGLVDQVSDEGVVVHVDRRADGSAVDPPTPIGPLDPPEETIAPKEE